MTPAAVPGRGGSTYGSSFPSLSASGPQRRALERERAVKNFAHPSFFRLFDLLLSLTNPRLEHSQWTHAGVQFERERYSVTGPKHGLVIEIFTLTRPGRRGWSLMVIKEYWWAGKESKALKNLRWARPTSGKRSDILAWLRAQEAKIGRHGFIDETGADLDYEDADDTLTALDEGDSA
jgi:hypothetical protein